MDYLKSKTSVILLLSTLTLAWAGPYYGTGFPRSEELLPILLSEKIHTLIYSIEEIQQIELASVLTFFPIGEDFFDLFEFLRLINVDRDTLRDLKDYAFKEVRNIRQLIYAHELKISDFVELLAGSAFIVRSGDPNPEQLARDLRAIEGAPASLIVDLWTAVMRVENLSEEFTARVDAATLDLEHVESHDLEIVWDKATTLSQAYADKFDAFSGALQKAQAAFDETLPALKYYVQVLRTEAKGQVQP